MQMRTLYVFVPYVRTRSRCVLRGIEFRPFQDREGLDDETKSHIDALGRMFHTCDGARIADPTFAVLNVPDDAGVVREDRSLAEAQLLITYLYGAPHPAPTIGDNPFLNAESFAFFTFVSNSVPTSLVRTTQEAVRSGRVVVDDGVVTPESDFTMGYEGYRNGDTTLWVAAGSRIYPELPHLCLNYHQYLDLDVQRFLSFEKNWPFRKLFERHELSPDNRRRVFTSLLWYSRSCRATADAAERLLALAIALETLLAIDKGERLTERFKEAVTTLVGRFPRLDEWLDQFYSARSSAVHEGRPHQLSFVLSNTKKEKLPHRALIMYGRRVFRICLATVLTGVLMTEESQLASLLVHNSERIRDICKALAQEQVSSRDRLMAVRRQIEELHECETLSMNLGVEEGFETLMGTARLVLSAYRDCNRNLDSEIERLLTEAISRFDSDGEQAAHESLTGLTNALRVKVHAEFSQSDVEAVVLRFLEFACRPAVAVEIHLRARRGAKSDKPSK